MTLPHGDGPFPLILDVHGGPVWAFADSWPGTFMGFLLSRGFALLQPNPRGSWGRGRDFASQVVGDMGGADAQDLLAGVDHVLEMGIADPGKIGVLGGSYGGFMAALLPCLDQRFAAAVSLSPVTDWYSERFDSNLGTWVQDFMGGPDRTAGGAVSAAKPRLHVRAQSNADAPHRRAARPRDPDRAGHGVLPSAARA